MDLDTGDLLLFCNNDSWFTQLIRYGSHSDYTHVAMILKDPEFIHPSLKGTFVWESSWEGNPDPQDGRIKLGVQITPLQEIIDSYHDKNIYVRKLVKGKCKMTTESLRDIHQVVYDKPYDVLPSDWLEALFGKDSSPQKTNRFWCSALVGYIYTKSGILDPSTDWSILSPNDFSLTAGTLHFTTDCYLEQSECSLKMT
tara:strand:+ start:189 stop:782 length:594 start_codon:yes stop_codon:yes gene_type:complete